MSINEKVNINSKRFISIQFHYDKKLIAFIESLSLGSFYHPNPNVPIIILNNK